VATTAQRAASAIGAVSGLAGIGLLVAPEEIAAALGLADPRGLREIALADLVLVPGLLAGRPRWPWLAGRAALNVAIAGWLLAAPPAPDARRLVPAGALLLVTVGDARLLGTLRAARA
jgi:hypothetical protein